MPGAADLRLRGWAAASGAAWRGFVPVRRARTPPPWGWSLRAGKFPHQEIAEFSDRSGDWKKFQIVREKSMQLLLKTAEKILEHKKQLSKICTPSSSSKKLKFFILRFGQDLLTCDECSSKDGERLALTAAWVVVPCRMCWFRWAPCSVLGRKSDSES